MRPRPTTPTVLSAISTPVYFERFHSPALSEAFAFGTCRATASSSATACSAAVTMLDCGALTTITPRAVAAATSTLSRPMPARATTLSRVAAASASASTLVALRIRIASASAMRRQQRGPVGPVDVADLEPSPRTARTEGASSSAMSTTGWVTGSSTARTAGPVES